MLIMLAPLFSAQLASSQTISTWADAVSGDYSTPANWSPQDVPGDSSSNDETARFNQEGSWSVTLPAGSTMAPYDFEMMGGMVTLEVGGAGTASLDIENKLVLNDEVQLAVEGGVDLSATYTQVNSNETGLPDFSTAELLFHSGATGDLGHLVVGDLDASFENLVTIQSGAQVSVGQMNIGDQGVSDDKTSLVQVLTGSLIQSPGATTTIGSETGQGLAVLAVTSNGLIETSSAGVLVRGMGRLTNLGGHFQFGGDVTLAGGAISFTEGLNATRSFAAGSTISMVGGAGAAFNSNTLMLTDAQTLSISGPDVLLETDGDVVLGATSTVQFELDPATQMTFDIASSSLQARVQSEGQVELAGSLEIDFLAGPAPTAGGALPLIYAEEGFTGAFDSLSTTYISGIGWDTQIVGDTLWLVASEALPGDFNSDGAVNAADYAVWRNSLGGPTIVGSYNDWRDNYGAVAASAQASGPVPEPCSLACMALLAGFCGLSRAFPRS